MNMIINHNNFFFENKVKINDFEIESGIESDSNSDQHINEQPKLNNIIKSSSCSSSTTSNDSDSSSTNSKILASNDINILNKKNDDHDENFFNDERKYDEKENDTTIQFKGSCFFFNILLFL
jgi:hypothetical protein